MRTHELKTDAAVFDAVLDGSKCFEFRKNDRDFRVGDMLVLKEVGYNAYGMYSTGKKCMRVVTYILHGGLYGVPAGYCVIGLRELTVGECNKDATNAD